MSVVVERRGFSLPLGVSPETEIFAVGDIHGRSDLLVALIDEAAREPKLRDRRAIVFLGDFVDRGLDVRCTFERVLDLGARHPVVAAVMGNHDLALVRAARLDGGAPSAYWIDGG